ncbi:MAG: hypothetical protein R3B68_01595 [Phycisphaerales bacterium]
MPPAERASPVTGADGCEPEKPGGIEKPHTPHQLRRTHAPPCDGITIMPTALLRDRAGLAPTVGTESPSEPWAASALGEPAWSLSETPVWSPEFPDAPGVVMGDYDDDDEDDDFFEDDEDDDDDEFEEDDDFLDDDEEDEVEDGSDSDDDDDDL